MNHSQLSVDDQPINAGPLSQPDEEPSEKIIKVRLFALFVIMHIMYVGYDFVS